MKQNPNETQPCFSPMYYDSLFKFLHDNRIRVEISLNSNSPGVVGHKIGLAMFFTFLSRMMHSAN